MPENFEHFVLAVGMVCVCVCVCVFVCVFVCVCVCVCVKGEGMGYKLHDYDLRPKIRMSV